MAQWAPVGELMKNWIIGIVLVLLAAGGWYFYQASQSRTEQAVPSPDLEVVQKEAPATVAVVEEAAVEVVEQTRQEVESKPLVEEEPLPSLQDSDPLAVDTLSSLVGEAMAVRYFASEDLISRLVSNIDALGSRQVPAAIQAVQGPEGEFEVTIDDQPDTTIVNEEGDPIAQYLVDPDNNRRYLVYVEMLEAVDVDQIAGLYRQHYPLFQEAWQQLGYPDGDFNQRLLLIIDELLATPEVEGSLRLKKPEAYYLFSDEELESLSAGQKIMLRMGSENAARVKSKLSEIRQAL